MRCARHGSSDRIRPNREVSHLCGFVLLWAAFGVAGCGGADSDALKKRVASLQDEVTLLQNAQDRLEERLAAVEMRAQEAAERPAKAEHKAGTFERPRLKVIKVKPGVEGPEPATGPAASPDNPPGGDEQDGPRPVIRGTGEEVESHLPAGSTSHRDERATKTGAAPALSGQDLDRRDSARARGA